MGVSPQASNLFTSRPLLTPQKSTARHRLRPVRFRVNSPVRWINSWLNRLLRMLTETMGGLVHTTPVHATVIKLAS